VADDEHQQVTRVHAIIPAAARRAFTLVEVLVVVVILGILAAAAAGTFAAVTNDGRTNATVAAVERTRAAIAAFRGRSVLAGTAAFPTPAELAAAGTVLDEGPPANPWTGATAVRTVSRADGLARIVSQPDQFGWCYFVDNASTPPVAIFYANTAEPTTLNDPDTGEPIPANEL
jgi:prepilin-type N-terminal cleavage/methylation domain-containing protein